MTPLLNYLATIFETGNVYQRSPERPWLLVLIVGDAFHTYSVSLCNLSLLQVSEVFYFTSPALHLQRDSTEIKDDIGLLCLPDSEESAELPINVKALLFLFLHSGKHGWTLTVYMIYK